MRAVLSEERVRLKRLAQLLDGMPLPDRAADQARRDVVRSVTGYILPRLDRPDTPLIVAIAGPGGAGKSYLANRITSEQHSPEGATRPTTTSPVAIISTRLEEGTRKDVERRMRASAAPVRFRRDHGIITERATLIDMPADSVGAPSHRALSLADLVIVVVTPARYADNATWSLLDWLDGLGIPCWVVLNRTIGTGDEVVADFEARLAAAGRSLPIFTIGEDTTGLGGLDEALVDLHGPARDRMLDDAIAAREGAILRIAAGLVRPFDALRTARADLAAAANSEYERTAEAVAELVAAALASSNETAWPVRAERLAAVITREIGAAAGRTASAWFRMPGGGELLESQGQGLWRHAAGAATDARIRLLRWEVEVAAVVEEQSKRAMSPERARDTRMAVMQRALGDPARIKWRIRRRLKGGVDPAVAAAKRRLAEMAAEIVRDDEQRFQVQLGQYPGPDAIAELTELTGPLNVESIGSELMATPDPEATDPAEAANA